MPENAATVRVTGVISVDFRDEPLQSVADKISRMVGVNIVVAPGIDQRVTIKLDNLPYEDALREIASRVDLIVSRKGPNLLRIENPPRVSITFTNADIKQAIDLLARQADVNVVVAEQVTGTVNLRLRNVPWEQALETLVKTAGFFLVKDESGAVTRVITKDMLKEQESTRVYPLKYIQPPSVYTAKIQTEFAVGQPKASIGDLEQDFTLFKAIKSTLSEIGQVSFDKDKNALVVTDIPTKLQEIDNVIRQIDIEPLQVFVDAKFVTTKRNDLLDFGTDWSQGRTAEPGVSVPGGLGTWGFVFGNPGVGKSLFSIGRTTSPPAPASLGGNFGVLDFTRMAPILNMIKQDDKSTITQAPKLLVLDNQQATIFVGETIRFAEIFSSSNQQGALEFGIREAANSPVQTGFQLLLIPHVIRELNQVILNVIPQFEALTGPDKGFDDFILASGAAGSEQEIKLPRISSDTVVTKLKMDSGQTAVIGGLVNESDSEQITKIPILGDLPLAGWLFKIKNNIKIKSNLYIFLTVYVIDRGQETRAAVAEEIETGNETRTGKPLYLKERMVKNAQEESQRMEDSRKAYGPMLRGSEFKPYER